MAGTAVAGRKIFHPRGSKAGSVRETDQKTPAEVPADETLAELPENNWVLTTPEDVALFHKDLKDPKRNPHADMLAGLAKYFAKERESKRSSDSKASK